jgi:hypothetical protein
VTQRIEADFPIAREQQILRVRRTGLHDDLILVIMLQPVRVFPVPAVGRAARRLHVSGGPGLRAERAQGGGGMKGARPHLHVEWLQDDAALLGPEGVQPQDQVLER